MFNIKNWFKGSKGSDNKSESKSSENYPKSKTDKLNQKEINDLRESEFQRLGIPFNMVILAEAHGIKNIDPRKLATETDTINTMLSNLGFEIKISYIESFESQLILLDYQKVRQNKYTTSGINLPERSLIDVIVMREAEKIIRNKYSLTENPTSGPVMQKFQTEVKRAIEFLLKKSLNYQLRQKAQRQIKHEKNLPENAVISEIDILAMMEKIEQKK